MLKIRRKKRVPTPNLERHYHYCNRKAGTTVHYRKTRVESAHGECSKVGSKGAPSNKQKTKSLRRKSVRSSNDETDAIDCYDEDTFVEGAQRSIRNSYKEIDEDYLPTSETSSTSDVSSGDVSGAYTTELAESPAFDAYTTEIAESESSYTNTNKNYEPPSEQNGSSEEESEEPSTGRRENEDGFSDASIERMRNSDEFDEASIERLRKKESAARNLNCKPVYESTPYGGPKEIEAKALIFSRNRSDSCEALFDSGEELCNVSESGELEPLIEYTAEDCTQISPKLKIHATYEPLNPGQEIPAPQPVTYPEKDNTENISMKKIECARLIARKKIRIARKTFPGRETENQTITNIAVFEPINKLGKLPDLQNQDSNPFHASPQNILDVEPVESPNVHEKCPDLEEYSIEQMRNSGPDLEESSIEQMRNSGCMPDSIIFMPQLHSTPIRECVPDRIIFTPQFHSTPIRGSRVENLNFASKLHPRTTKESAIRNSIFMPKYPTTLYDDLLEEIMDTESSNNEKESPKEENSRPATLSLDPPSPPDFRELADLNAIDQGGYFAGVSLISEVSIPDLFENASEKPDEKKLNEEIKMPAEVLKENENVVEKPKGRAPETCQAGAGVKEIQQKVRRKRTESCDAEVDSDSVEKIFDTDSQNESEIERNFISIEIEERILLLSKQHSHSLVPNVDSEESWNISDVSCWNLPVISQKARKTIVKKVRADEMSSFPEESSNMVDASNAQFNNLRPCPLTCRRNFLDLEPLTSTPSEEIGEENVPICPLSMLHRKRRLL